MGPLDPDDDTPLFADEGTDDELVFADEDEDELLFADEDDESGTGPAVAPWRVLIVDDDPEVHSVTRLALSNFTFEGRVVELLSAYSGAEAREAVAGRDDIALILLDVVMETEHSGLDFVKYLREEADNHTARVVLRTGQPGQAPERDVVLAYDINDYKSKTELTSSRLFTTVVVALRSFEHLRRVTEFNRVARLFVPNELVEQLGKPSLIDLALGDHAHHDMAILFSDLRSFSTLSEQWTPKETFDFLNRYLAELGPIVRSHGGYVDKYIGDAIMALFPGGAVDAVRAAVAMRAQVRAFNAQQRATGAPEIDMGVGVHAGRLILGIIGEERRMDGTVISDAVNVAARLEGLSKPFGAGVLVSRTVADELGPQWQTRFLGETEIRGRAERMGIFEVLDGETEPRRATRLATRKTLEAGVQALSEGRTAEAATAFDAVLAEDPADTAAQWLRSMAGD